MSKVQIGYWNIRGLAQPVRMLLEHLEVPYEDKHYELTKKDDGRWNNAQWADVKHSMGIDFPNLPYIIDGDVKVSQSVAVLRHICRKYRPDMLGKTPKDMAEVDQMMDFMVDYKTAMVKVAYGNPAGDIQKSIDELFEKTVNPALKSLSSYLADRKYIVTDYITMADFYFYEMMHVTRLMRPSVFDAPDRQCFKKFLDSFASQPKIKEYIASDRCIQKQVNNYVAHWQGPTAVDAPRG